MVLKVSHVCYNMSFKVGMYPLFLCANSEKLHISIYAFFLIFCMFTTYCIMYILCIN